MGFRKQIKRKIMQYHEKADTITKEFYDKLSHRKNITAFYIRNFSTLKKQDKELSSKHSHTLNIQLNGLNKSQRAWNKNYIFDNKTKRKLRQCRRKDNKRLRYSSKKYAFDLSQLNPDEKSFSIIKNGEKIISSKPFVIRLIKSHIQKEEATMLEQQCELLDCLIKQLESQVTLRPSGVRGLFSYFNINRTLKNRFLDKKIAKLHAEKFSKESTVRFFKNEIDNFNQLLADKNYIVENKNFPPVKSFSMATPSKGRNKKSNPTELRKVTLHNDFVAKIVKLLIIKF